MSRKAGTPNKPKVENRNEQKFVYGIKEEQTGVMDNYITVTKNDPLLLQKAVNLYSINDGYAPQGGVSVTNYRGLDGKIVMVYCQALVRKE